MAAVPQISRLQPANLPTIEVRPARFNDLPESARSFRQVFRGRELTLKTRRIGSGLDPVDRLIGGGVVRGRISEIVGPTGAGKTSLAMAFAAMATRDEAAAWIEAHDSLDPASLIAAGVEPARMLWVSCGHPHLPRARQRSEMELPDESASHYRAGGTEQGAAESARRGQSKVITCLKTAEWVLAAGGFGLVVIDFGHALRFIPSSAALRLARAAERSGAAIIVLAQQRMCGTFAVLSLELSRQRAHFNRIARGACATFDGQALAAHVMRNKLGGAGGTALWSTAVDPHATFAPPLEYSRSDPRARSGPAKIVAGTPARVSG
ncbi:MAG: AAA family ATPase [Candidatus Binataceae bacterium]